LIIGSSADLFSGVTVNLDRCRMDVEDKKEEKRKACINLERLAEVSLVGLYWVFHFFTLRLGE